MTDSTHRYLLETSLWEVEDYFTFEDRGEFGKQFKQAKVLWPYEGSVLTLLSHQGIHGERDVAFCVRLAEMIAVPPTVFGSVGGVSFEPDLAWPAEQQKRALQLFKLSGITQERKLLNVLHPLWRQTDLSPASYEAYVSNFTRHVGNCHDPKLGVPIGAYASIAEVTSVPSSTGGRSSFSLNEYFTPFVQEVQALLGVSSVTTFVEASISVLRSLIIGCLVSDSPAFIAFLFAQKHAMAFSDESPGQINFEAVFRRLFLRAPQEPRIPDSRLWNYEQLTNEYQLAEHDDPYGLSGQPDGDTSYLWHLVTAAISEINNGMPNNVKGLHGCKRFGFNSLRSLLALQGRRWRFGMNEWFFFLPLEVRAGALYSIARESLVKEKPLGITDILTVEEFNSLSEAEKLGTSVEKISVRCATDSGERSEKSFIFYRVGDVLKDRLGLAARVCEYLPRGTSNWFNLSSMFLSKEDTVKIFVARPGSTKRTSQFYRACDALAVALEINPATAGAFNNLAFSIPFGTSTVVNNIPYTPLKAACRALELTPNRSIYWDTFGTVLLATALASDAEVEEVELQVGTSTLKVKSCSILSTALVLPPSIPEFSYPRTTVPGAFLTALAMAASEHNAQRASLHLVGVEPMACTWVHLAQCMENEGLHIRTSDLERALRGDEIDSVARSQVSKPMLPSWFSRPSPTVEEMVRHAVTLDELVLVEDLAASEDVAALRILLKYATRFGTSEPAQVRDEYLRGQGAQPQVHLSEVSLRVIQRHGY